MRLFSVSARWNTLFLAVMCCAHLVGCGGPAAPKREFAPVTGKVTYKGEPLKMGKIAFQPASGARVEGEIKPDGTYSLDGVIGPNQVTITDSEPPAPVAAENRKAAPPPALAKSSVPAIYGTFAGNLKFDVKAGTNKADFDLK